MLRRLVLVGFLSGSLAAGVGCKHCHWLQKKDTAPTPPPMFDDPVPSRGGRIPSPSLPTSPDSALPPPVIPEQRNSFFRTDVPPSPGSWVPPGGSDLPAVPRKPPQKEVILPDPFPGASKSVAPVIDLPLEIKPAGFLEEPIVPKDNSDLPGAAAPAPAPPPIAPAPKPIAPPSVALEAPTAGSQAGLPGFGKVPGHPNLTTGRKPTLDGLDWLKTNGYRSVVYVYTPGTDPAPARELATKRGLNFVAVPMTPAGLRKAFDEFAKEVNDSAGKPIYVADVDGQASWLWYLLFRTSDYLGDDAARVRAAPFGLPEAKTDEQKQYWLAVQEYLANR